MSEENTQTQKRVFNLQRIYTKDISFETPSSPLVFTKPWKPEVKVAINSGVQELGEGNYDVVLTVTVTASQDDSTSYLAEVHQAGIFQVQNFPQEELGPMFGIYCPNVLFPYAREVISDLVTRGSFPQFLLNPVNFDAIYQQNLEKAKAQSDSEHSRH